MGVVIAGAAIAAVGAIGSAVIAKKSQDKAIAAQKDALASQKGIDIGAVQQQAKDADLQKYKDQFKLLGEVDPTTAAIRDQSNAALLNSVNDTNSANSNSILQSLFNENANVDPNDAAFAAKLKSKAQEQLDLGGSLSPEAQSEFVRAGLETASGAGFNPGSNATKQGVGKLLFTESNALEQQRAKMAQELFGFATDLNTTRNQQLLGISNAAQTKSALDQNKLLNLAQLADSRTPNIGLSGGDIANLAVGNTNQANAVAAQKGAVDAANAQARGQITAGLVGNLASVAGTAIQGYGASRAGVGAKTSYEDFLKNNPTSSAARGY